MQELHCTDQKIGLLITRFELGGLNESEKEAFVAHLYTCHYCHDQVFTMAPFMRALREAAAKAKTAKHEEDKP